MAERGTWSFYSGERIQCRIRLLLTRHLAEDPIVAVFDHQFGPAREKRIGDGTAPPGKPEITEFFILASYVEASGQERRAHSGNALYSNVSTVISAEMA
jgi:hypothetical protein